jgi:hypothetical protein
VTPHPLTPQELFRARPETVRYCITARMARTGEDLKEATAWWENLVEGVKRGVEADEETIAGHLRNVLMAGAKR